MLSKKYHAIAFVSILVMLLLLGLHLLGLGFGSGGSSSIGLGGASQALASASSSRSAALARNASSSSGSSLNYEHPIAYDKLTGATNNQISEVLGVKRPPSDLPLDHYQRQQLQLQQQQQQAPQLPFGNSLDDFFAAGGNYHLRNGPPPSLGHHPMMAPNQAGGAPPMHHMHHVGNQMSPPPMQMPPPHHMMQMRPPLPPPPQPAISHENRLMPSNLQNQPPTTQAPTSQQNQLPFNFMSNQPQSSPNSGDSIPLASSLDGAQPTSSNMINNSTGKGQYHQTPLTHYYTPPIFAYNNNNNNNQPIELYHHQNQQQQPPVGVPDVPLSVDEYNTRQARLRQLANQPHQASLASSRSQPQQQHLMFADDPNHRQQHNQTPSYYPDPAFYNNQRPPSGQMQLINRAPYAQLQQHVPGNNNPISSNAIHNNPNQRLMLTAPEGRSSLPSVVNSQAPASHRVNPNNPAINGQLIAAAQTNGARQPSSAQVIMNQGDNPNDSQAQQRQLPTCARQLMANNPINSNSVQMQLELANSSSQLPVTYCTEDTDYPIREIMRALEAYAVDRSIEQLLPQSMVQVLVLSANNQQQSASPANKAIAEFKRQLAIDSLQPEVLTTPASGQQQIGDNSLNDNNVDLLSRLKQQQFPSNNYEQMCKSLVFVAQPKRAKNLQGQWKVVVNLPGHKYRGIAISQMVRVEECSRPNGECQMSSKSSSSNSNLISSMPRSRCLQQYENQRLVAWSHQQGLHLDIFRMPSACSCHLKRVA